MTAVSAFAAGAPRGGLSAKSFGEDGGYRHPDGAAVQYLEDEPRRDRPSPDPLPAHPPPAAPAAPGSLLSGLVQPLDMPAEDAGAADADSASELGRRDYESRLLGLEDAPTRPRTRGPERSPTAHAGAGEGMLFVSLELDPRESGSLRDCVAGLGAVAGFAADARFEPLAGPAGSVLISGWMPAAGLAAALSRPGVKRLRVETRPRPSAPRQTMGEFLVRLRLEDPAHARAAVDAGVAALASAAGFRLTRVVGLETSADGRGAAVVAGRLPLSRLAKAMGRADVLKISPLGPASADASESLSPARPSGARSFARFALERGLWLVLLTLAMALPLLRRAAGRALRVFVPYR